MVAYFSSKLTKQVHAAIAVALLMACMMGTHWIGFAHSISHASIQQQSISPSSADEFAPTSVHSSDICHLLDALTLAGFIPEAFIGVLLSQTTSFVLASPLEFHFAQAALSAYQSRAPPTDIL
jgi:hypothetical protein